jgi:hypothetical protein
MSVPIMSKTEVMKLVSWGRVHESFEHEHEGRFDVTAIRMLSPQIKGEVHELPIHDVLAFILINRVLDVQRVRDLDAESWRNDPAIAIQMVRDGITEHLLIDGVHRIMRRHQEGLQTFRCYVIDEKHAIRPDLNKWQPGVERGIDWGDAVVDGKIVKRGH